MERTFKQHRVEAVKITMLKQEEIFRQQVRELHRLYSVQRMLMEEVRTRHGWERSGSCSGGDSNTRINAQRSLGFGFDMARVGGDSSTGVSITVGPSSSCSTMKEELCGLDLTLSIGGGDKMEEIEGVAVQRIR